MSHHFDYPEDETLDISDVYCFSGAGDKSGPRTVFGMNTSPTHGAPWNPKGYYELKIDTNDDYVEDITYRATFPIDSDGTQHVRVEELTGSAATDRNASGTIITPPGASVGEVVECSHGIKLFAGQRRDPFYFCVAFALATQAALTAGTSPDYAAAGPARDDFLDTSVRSFVIELPAEITGLRPVHFWGNTAIYDPGHSTWRQLQRAAAPLVGIIYDFSAGSAQADYNATVPTGDLAGRPAQPEADPASGIWGQVRDSTAAVVAARGSYGNGPHGKATALAYGAWVADTLLPNVLTFTPGTSALWDPWQGTQNGKGLVEDTPDNIIKMVINEDFSLGFGPRPLLDDFPHVSPPPAS